MPRLEINYLSPMATYNFSNTNKYFLVISYTNIDRIIIYKYPISLNNVNSTLRAYHIGKSLKIPVTEVPIMFTVQIFKLDHYNTLTLLFTNVVDPSTFEYYNIKAITLYSTVLNKHTKYDNEASFLSEQFYNYEMLSSVDQCIIFFTLKREDINDYLRSNIILISSLPKNVSYNKYHQIFTLPIEPNNNLQFNNYSNFVKHYQIDISKYLKKNNTNFKDMFLRKIDMEKRLVTHNSSLNNVITCPTDCSKVKILSNVSFSCELSPSNYPRVHMPYQGYLLDIRAKYLPNNKLCYILNFTNDYFIPPSVDEREYISVVYGQNINVSRGYPELVAVQPDTRLFFDLILVGSSNKESIIITNNKLEKFVPLKNKKKLWFDKGEEMCGFNDCLGQIIVSFNRNLLFGIQNGFNNFIKLNDTIGFIQ